MSDVSRRLVQCLADGGFVSGQAVADALGVTRAAVNQHVARLKDNGLEIHSVRGRGYRLARPLELLDVERIRLGLASRTTHCVKAIEIVDTVDSTNRHMKASHAAGRPLDACLAEFQSAGRGRRGRHWLAAPYASILLSFSHELPGGPSASAGLSLAAGLAAARAVADCGCADVALKWPNDLMLGGAKFGGILVEIAGELGERCLCVVGVGLNVEMPARLAAQCARPVTSMAEHATSRVSRNALAAALISHLVDVLARFNEAGFEPLREAWIARHVHQDKGVHVQVGQTVVSGIARGVDADGALLVETPGGLKRITTGEVE